MGWENVAFLCVPWQGYILGVWMDAGGRAAAARSSTREHEGASGVLRPLLRPLQVSATPKPEV